MESLVFRILTDSISSSPCLELLLERLHLPKGVSGGLPSFVPEGSEGLRVSRLSFLVPEGSVISFREVSYRLELNLFVLFMFELLFDESKREFSDSFYLLRSLCLALLSLWVFLRWTRLSGMFIWETIAYGFFLGSAFRGDIFTFDLGGMTPFSNWIEFG